MTNTLDPEIKVTKIKQRWHARLFYKGGVYDEMACDQRQDIGYICRTMMRWFDKCGGMSLFASRSRHRLGTKKPYGFIGTIWHQNQLNKEKDERNKHV